MMSVRAQARDGTNAAFLPSLQHQSPTNAVSETCIRMYCSNNGVYFLSAREINFKINAAWIYQFALP